MPYTKKLKISRVHIAFVVILATYYSYTTYYEMKNDNITSGALIFTTDFSYYLTLEKTWLAFGCTSATLTAILLLIILFLRKRIMIAIALIKEGSRYAWKEMVRGCVYH